MTAAGTETLDKFDQIILLNLLDERARLLDDSFRDRSYDESFEYKLARELIAGLSPAQRHDALEWLVHDKMRTRSQRTACSMNASRPATR